MTIKKTKGYNDLLKENPNAVHPVYIIGSEVPIPGGSQETEDMQITKPYDFEQTILTYKKVFKSMNLNYAWDYIVGIVVQPGVEFGCDDVVVYQRDKALELCNTLKKYPDIVFEGHSTDYQPAKKLGEMVADGIAILKVGPALTNALREGLSSLNHIEENIIDVDKQSKFTEVLENEMLKDTSKWKKHYHGSELDMKIMRKYSFSDRSRYYISSDNVQQSIDKLMNNLSDTDVPLSLLHQYMPNQAKRIISGELKKDVNDILKACVAEYLRDYINAVNKNYINL